MLIQVGELAKRAGMTVRTLHHYEQLGLLLPSARSAAGYRLYNLADVQRLHMIRVLAKAGLELAAIKDFLEQQSLTLPELLNAQIESLEQQMRRIDTLRDQLIALRTELQAESEADLESWLHTLELMNMYDHWFTKEELQQLPFIAKKEPQASIWAALVQEAGATVLNTGIGWHEARVPTIITQVPRAAWTWSSTTCTPPVTAARPPAANWGGSTDRRPRCTAAACCWSTISSTKAIPCWR